MQDNPLPIALLATAAAGLLVRSLTNGNAGGHAGEYPQRARSTPGRQTRLECTRQDFEGKAQRLDDSWLLPARALRAGGSGEHRPPDQDSEGALVSHAGTRSLDRRRSHCVSFPVSLLKTLSATFLWLQSGVVGRLNANFGRIRTPLDRRRISSQGEWSSSTLGRRGEPRRVVWTRLSAYLLC